MRSTLGQLKEFFEESFIWKDICEELDSWIADNHLILEDRDNKMTLEEFKAHSAICRALTEVKRIDSYLLQDLEQEG